MEEVETIFEKEEFKQVCKGLSEGDIRLARSFTSRQKDENWGDEFRNLPKYRQVRVIAAILTAAKLKAEEIEGHS